MSISKHDLFKDHLAFVLLTSTFFGTVFQLVSCQLVRVTGTNTWSEHPVGFLYNFSRYSKTNEDYNNDKMNNTHTHCVPFALSNIILYTRKWTNHNAMRHFLFGILFVFTILFSISSQHSTCFIDFELEMCPWRWCKNNNTNWCEKLNQKKVNTEQWIYNWKAATKYILFSARKKKCYTYIRVIEKQSTVVWGSGTRTTTQSNQSRNNKKKIDT